MLMIWLDVQWMQVISGRCTQSVGVAMLRGPAMSHGCCDDRTFSWRGLVPQMLPWPSGRAACESLSGTERQRVFDVGPTII